MNYLLRSLVLAGLAVIAPWCDILLLAQPADSVEYKIKAGYMFNFAKFIEWPKSAFAAPDSPVRIGVLGKDPFGADLDSTIGGKSIEGRPIELVRINDEADLHAFHLLFISPAERRRTPQILERLKSSSVVTISEFEQFGAQGGMINFFLQGNTVRFEINLDAVARSNIKVSSKLLQVARIVRDGRPK